MKSKLDIKTSRKLYFFTFIMSMLVVYCHTNGGTYYKVVEIGTGKLNHFFYVFNFTINELAFSVNPFFILSSSFLLFHTFSKENMKKIFLNRLIKWSAIYIFWGIITFLILWYPYPQINMPTFMNLLFLENPDGPLWFIEILIIYLFALPLHVLLLQHKKITCIFLIVSIPCSYLIPIYLLGLPITTGIDILIYRIIHYYPIYLLGSHLGYNYFTLINEEKYNSNYLKVFAIILFILPYLNISQFFSTTWRIFQIICLWILIDKNSFNKETRWFEKQSIYTYTGQWILIGLLNRIFMYFNWHNIRATAMIVFGTRMATVLIITIITVLIGTFISKYIPNINYILTGNINKISYIKKYRT